MAELQDYSGELQQTLRLEDFSKDTLAKFYLAASRLYCGIDGMWYSLIRERFDERRAQELDREIWRRIQPMDVHMCCEVANIQGNDVASALKYLQVSPGAGAVWPGCIAELKDKNHGILTIPRCLGLDYYERHGDWELQKYICGVLDMEAIQEAADFFNPKIKVTNLKLPPRKSKDEPACIWEFRLEE